ncbi:hypothetical protein [Caballeronia sp. M23-90]
MTLRVIGTGLVLGILVAGCATPPQQTTAGAVRRMVGKPIDYAIDALGYPTSDREIVGHRVVAWEVNEQVGTTAVYDEVLRTKITKNVVKKCKIEMEIGFDMRVIRGRNEGSEYDCSTYRVAMYKRINDRS